MRLLITALLVCLLAVPAFAADAPTMPWTTFSGEMVTAVRGSNMARCPGLNHEIFIALFEHRSTLFVMFFDTVTAQIIFLYDPAPNNKSALPTHIGFGVVDNVTPGRHDYIPALRWEPYRSELHSDICSLFFNRT